MDSSRFPKLSAVRSSQPATTALLRKLNPDPQQGHKSSGQNKSINLNRFGMEKLSNQTAQDIIDSDSTMQLLPDLELAEQILVGSILSPKDMSTADIQFNVGENQFDGPIAGRLLEPLITHFKFDYKIDERLDIQLENILTKTGATILLTLPENNIDQIINGNTRVSTEDFQSAVNRLQAGKPLGFLGHPTEARVSMEHFGNGADDAAKLRDFQGRVVEHLTITDNFNVLKQAGFRERLRTRRISDRIGKLNASLEQASQGMSLTTEQIDALYKNRSNASKAIEVITPQAFMNRPSVGHPLSLDVPPEAVMPVFPPGKPEEHVGYFILIDIHGRFVNKSSNRDHFMEMKNSFGNSPGSKDNSSELLRLTRDALGVSDTSSTFEAEQIQQTYATIIENDLQNRLRNGMYDEELDIGFTEELTKIMLTRQFKRQQTQILYVPVELVSYIAFNFNKDGIGQTLMAKSKILSSMRSVLLFAETMGAVRNAVGRKKVQITLDPDDPDKTDTVAKIQEMIMEVARNGFPIGAPDPAQSLDYLNRAAYDFSINAESEDYGQTKVEYDDYNTNVQAGNPDFQDRLRRMQVSGWGVPPEKVDPTASPDFAVGVVQNDLIMTRRVKRYQRIFCHGQTKFVRTYTRNSSILIDQLMAIIDEHKGELTEEQAKLEPEELVRQFIDVVEVRLPEPDTTRMDLMSQAFQQFSDLLNNALDAYITPDLFPDESFAGASGAADRFKNIVAGYFKRQYMAQNNILPELNILHEMADDKPAFNLLDVQESYMNTLGTCMQEFLKQEGVLREKWKQDFPAPKEDAGGGDFGDGGFGSDAGGGDDAFGDGGDSFGNDDGTGGDFGGDEGGGDEFGAGSDDLSGDEAPPADEGGGSLDLDAPEAGGDEPALEAEEEAPEGLEDPGNIPEGEEEDPDAPKQP